jgi:hypothetical protein
LLADWSEIDFKAKVWTIPGPRHKGKTLGHVVPGTKATTVAAMLWRYGGT